MFKVLKILFTPYHITLNVLLLYTSLLQDYSKVALWCRPFHFLLLIACWDLGAEAYSSVVLGVKKCALQKSPVQM